VSLCVQEIVKRYGKNVAVDHVSFEAPEGGVFGLLGANGAGKTTTVRMVLSIIRPDEGRVLWRGEPVERLPRRLFGYLPEERGLYPEMKVAEQLLFFARLRGVGKSEARDGIGRWLGRLGIEEYRDRPLEQLSKGNQQKVQLAATVLHGPEVLILDEPFSGLDPVNNELVREVIRELAGSGTTVLLSTHDMERVEDLCEEVALVHRSRLVFAGPLSGIKRRYAHRRTLRLDFDGDVRALLGRFPGLEVDGEEQGLVELSGLDGVRPEEVLEAAMRLGRVSRFEEVEPSLRGIFIQEVGGA
jgi:ABC-2 type transport system ATP-binding protein